MAESSLRLNAAQVSLGNAQLPPMLGTYQLQTNSLRFEPQFPLQPGLAYQAIFHPSQLPAAVRGPRISNRRRLYAASSCPNPNDDRHPSVSERGSSA